MSSHLILSRDPRYGFEINRIYADLVKLKELLTRVPAQAVIVKNVSGNAYSLYKLPAPSIPTAGWLPFPYDGPASNVLSRATPVPYHTELKAEIKTLEGKIKSLTNKAAADSAKEKDKEAATAALAAIQKRREEDKKKLATDLSDCISVSQDQLDNLCKKPGSIGYNPKSDLCRRGAVLCSTARNAADARNRDTIRFGNSVTIEEVEQEKRKANPPKRNEVRPRSRPGSRPKLIPKPRARR